MNNKMFVSIDGHGNGIIDVMGSIIMLLDGQLLSGSLDKGLMPEGINSAQGAYNNIVTWVNKLAHPEEVHRLVVLPQMFALLIAMGEINPLTVRQYIRRSIPSLWYDRFVISSPEGMPRTIVVECMTEEIFLLRYGDNLSNRIAAFAGSAGNYVRITE